ncbi:MAG: accessory factor UbiK family protein [Gammaproteobacteria bacterium]|jgi:BMFP domain-containing protein YqiC
MASTNNREVNMAFDPKQLDELTDKVMNLLPKGVRDVQQDIEKNVRAVLQSTFAKMDLVTREEFDVQSAVLTRTREKLEQLEKQVAELEEKSR